jgi:hypothetical protein
MSPTYGEALEVVSRYSLGAHGVQHPAASTTCKRKQAGDDEYDKIKSNRYTHTNAERPLSYRSATKVVFQVAPENVEGVLNDPLDEFAVDTGGFDLSRGGMWRGTWSWEEDSHHRFSCTHLHSRLTSCSRRRRARRSISSFVAFSVSISILKKKRRRIVRRPWNQETPLFLYTRRYPSSPLGACRSQSPGGQPPEDLACAPPMSSLPPT